MVRLLELFGGIGACSKALERCGIDYEIADYVETDKYAVKSYNAIHGTRFEPQDITQWDKNIKVDLIMHGSPCQDFSIAGNNAGGDKGSGTRSSLMYETIRIVKKLNPQIVIWENVKNLLSKKHKHNFNDYVEQMQALGYTNQFKVLNSSKYGIPQNRERVFVVSIREQYISFAFPKEMPLKLCLKDVLEPVVDKKYYLSNAIVSKVLNSDFRQEHQRIQHKECCDTLLSSDYKHVKLTKIKTVGNYMPSKHEASRIVDSNGIAPTVKENHGTVTAVAETFSREKECLVIRKLTPLEYWRLMGFDDEDFKAAAKVNSDTQLYKQAGNSIVVNVLCEIVRQLRFALEEKNGGTDNNI